MSLILKVKAYPNSSKNSIVKKSEDSFEIMVKEKPVKGLANKRIVLMLSTYFKISENKVKLIKGFKTRNKIFKIEN